MTKYRSVFRTILLSALVTCTGIRDAAAAGDIYNLGTLGGAESYGIGINDAGQVAGFSNTTGGNVRPFRYSGTPGSGGAMADLGTLGGTQSFGWGINGAGQVTGESTTTGGDIHAFLYTGTPGSDGAMADLGTFGGQNSYGLGINGAGQVAGMAQVIGDAGYHAFRYSGTPGLGGAMADLGTLGGTQSFGLAINEAGQVAGWSDITGDDNHAFRYSGTPGSGGSMVDLGTLGGTNSGGNAINDAGFVVGGADRSASAGGGSWATLWQTDAANTAVDLDAWLDATNPTLGAYWSLSVALDINNNGLITGYGLYNDGPGGLSDGRRAYILDAGVLVGVPEPATLALAFLGAAALAVRRNRRITNLLCLFCALSITAAAHAATYTVTDLGIRGESFSNSVGTGINASGQVSGSSYTNGYAEFQAFLWTPTTPNGASGTMIDLGTLGGSSSNGYGINSSGQVAGLSFTTGDIVEHATLWAPTMPNGTSGTLHDLGTLGGNWSDGFGINDSGQVTGYSSTGDEAHAFMWKPTTPGGTSGAMYDLGTLGGTYSEGHDINANGQVAGYSFTTGDSAGHAFLWKPTLPNGTSGTMHDLGTLGGDSSDVVGINDSGQVTGSSVTDGDENSHAYLWTPTTPNGTSGTMEDLTTLGGLNSYSRNNLR